jgi:dienelactone hydrolase
VPSLIAALVLLAAAGAPASPSPTPPPAETPPLWLHLAAGSHPVGFTLLNRRDDTRPQADGSGRPLQIGLWYPASRAPQPKPAEPLRYADYVQVSASETSLAEPSPADAEKALAAYRSFLGRQGLTEAGVTAWLDARLFARRDAPAAPVRFPLVLVAQGNGGAVPDQAVLGELLASHGFVVATTPSPVRLGNRLESEADVRPVADAQAQDLAFALELLRQDRRVDARRVAVVGYSVGARAALLLAAREPAVKALVSRDGGIGTASGGAWVTPKALDAARFETPILHVYEDADEAMVPDFALLDALAQADQTRVKVEGLRHYDFITLGFAKAALPVLGAAPEEAATLAQRLDAAASYALRFVQAHLTGNAKAREFLAREPSANGYAAFLTLTRKPAARRPPPRP